MKLFTRLFVIVLVFLVLTGCKKDETSTSATTTSETVTDDEIADAVAKSLVSGDAGCGLTGVIEISGQTSAGNAATQHGRIASPTLDSTIQKSGSTQYATYNYLVSIKITFVKNGKDYQIYVPTCDTARVSIKSYGQVTANKGQFVYNDTTYLGNTYISGIVASSDTFKLSGQAYYFSNFAVPAKNRTYTLSTYMQFNSIKMPKDTRVISSGSISISLQATLNNGKTVSAYGIITFNGNQMATLTFNNKNYTINLNSGTVVV